MEKFQSDFVLEELSIDMQMLNGITKQNSIITGLSSSSVEVFNEADKKSVRKKMDEEGNYVGLKGISSKNWYDMSQFNRTFKRL
jgi:hypothetical protein